MGIRRIARKIKQKWIAAEINRISALERRLEKLEGELYFLEYLSIDMPNANVGKLIKVHFINRIGRRIKGNCGDYNCGPYPYFKEYFKNCRCYFHRLMSVDYSVIQKGDYCIFGGGGLIDHCDEWNEDIEKVNAISENVIIWGAGKNTHTGDSCKNLDLSKFRMVGIRDFIDIGVGSAHVRPACFMNYPMNMNVSGKLA